MGSLGKWRLKRDEGGRNGGLKERKIGKIRGKVEYRKAGEMEAKKRGRFGKLRLRSKEGVEMEAKNILRWRGRKGRDG